MATRKYKVQQAFDHGKLVIVARMAEQLSGLSQAICPEATTHFGEAYFACNRAIRAILEGEAAERTATRSTKKKARK